MTLADGTYTLYCPGAAKENTAVTVTGTAAAPADQTTAALLTAATANYAKYVTTQVGYLLESPADAGDRDRVARYRVGGGERRPVGGPAHGKVIAFSSTAASCASGFS